MQKMTGSPKGQSKKEEPKPKVIPKSALEHGAWYRGVHRCGNVAVWDEKIKQFWYVEFSMGRYGFSTCLHPEDDVPGSRIAFFTPFEKLQTKPSDEECILSGKLGAQ